MTSALNSSTSGAIVWRIASRSIGRAQISSMQRSRDFARVRGLSAVSTTPSSTAMIGLTESSVPIAAWAPLIRPPFLRYSSVSSETYIRRSDARSLRTRAISSADTPELRHLEAHVGEDPLGHRRALRVDDVDLAVRQHARGDLGALDRPRQLARDVDDTIASAPSANASS